MTIRLNGRYIAGNAQKTNSDWNAVSGYAQILNKPTNLAHTTGDETISGVKTFASIPLVPTASTASNDTQAANALLVDNKITAHNIGNNTHSDIRTSISNLQTSIQTLSTNTVHKTGDETISGVKTFTNNISAPNIIDDKYLTNCIKEIPQDIKLDLINGDIILKEGSKIYIPNGFENDGATLKFETVITQEDITNEAITQANTSFIRYNYTTGKLFCDWDVSAFESGSSVPSGYTGWFYNTTLNIIRYYTNGVIDAPEQSSLPLGIVTNNSNSVESINQVFNGFGFIGSAVFVLPDVDVLFPYGRESNGNYKSYEYKTSDVIIVNPSSTTLNGRWNIYLYPNNIILQPSEAEYISNYKPTSISTQVAYWYSPEDNAMYLTMNSGASWTKQPCMNIGFVSESSSKISFIRTKDMVEIVNSNIPDYKKCYNISSGFIAPANGVLRVQAYINGGTAFGYIDDVEVYRWLDDGNSYGTSFIPIGKGSKWTCSSGFGIQQFFPYI